MIKLTLLLCWFCIYTYSEIKGPEKLGIGIMPYIHTDKKGHMHVVSGFSKMINYYKSTVPGVFEPVVMIPSGLSSGTVNYTRIISDKNDNLHICFTNGTLDGSQKIFYLNNIGGIWTQAVQIASSQMRMVGPRIKVDDSLNVFITSGKDDSYGGTSDLIKVTDVTGTPTREKHIMIDGRVAHLGIDSNGIVHLIYSDTKSVYWEKYNSDLTMIGSRIKVSNGIIGGLTETVGADMGPDQEMHYICEKIAGALMMPFYNNTGRSDQDAINSNIYTAASGRSFNPIPVWINDTIFFIF
ncbi:MAG: hypothetical protein ABIA63_15090, partial [bacterium]